MANLIKTYNNTEELMRELEARQPGSFGYGGEMSGGFCSASGPAALDMLTGKAAYNSPVISLSDKMLSEIKAADRAIAKNNFSVDYAIAGSEPDLDRYLTGEPENMRVYTPSHQKRAINIIISPEGNANIKEDTFINRGAAALAVVNALHATGRYNINLKVLLACKYNGNTMAWIYNMDLTRIWSRNLLAFMTVSPAFLRRIGFMLIENAEKKPHCGGYGHAASFSELERAFSGADDKAAWIRAVGAPNARIIFDRLNENMAKADAMAQADRIIKQYCSAVK